MELKFATVPEFKAETKYEIPGSGGLVIRRYMLDSSQTLLFKRLFLPPLVEGASIKPSPPIIIGGAEISLGGFSGAFFATPSIYIVSGKDQSSITTYYDAARWVAATIMLNKLTLLEMWTLFNNLFTHRIEPGTFYDLVAAMLSAIWGDDLMSHVPTEDEVKLFVLNAFLNEDRALRDFRTASAETLRMIGSILETQLSQLQAMQRKQEELEPKAGQTEFYPSNITVLEATYQLTVDPTSRLLSQPLQFFDNLILSPATPFVAYLNPEGKMYAKIYKGFYTKPIEEKKLGLQRHLVVQVISTLPVNVMIDLRLGSISFKTNEASLRDVISKLRTLGIASVEGKIIRVDYLANITLTKRDDRDFPLLHRRSFIFKMLMEPEFYNIIQMNDQKKPNFFRRVILMQYQPFADILSKIMRTTALSESTEEGAVNIKVNIDKASSGRVVFKVSPLRTEEDLRSLAFILGRLVYVYKRSLIRNDQAPEDELYRAIFGEEKVKRSSDALSQLRNAAPDIFNEDYKDTLGTLNRDTPARIPRLITSPAEMLPGGQYIKLIIMGREFILGPSSTKYTHFGLRANKIKGGTPPFFPIYYRKPQMGGSSETVFNTVMGVPLLQAGRIRKETSTETNRICHSCIGTLPTAIEDLLTKPLIPDPNAPANSGRTPQGLPTSGRVSLLPEGSIITRRGVERGNSPMLNAVYVAVYAATQKMSASARSRSAITSVNESKYYNPLERFDEIRGRIQDMRVRSLSVNGFVAKQELYDLTPREIEANVRNLNFPLTSDYIRVYEEMLNVNIFVFEFDKSEKRVKAKIPRHINSYVKYFNPERSSVLLYELEEDINLIVYEPPGTGGVVFTTFSPEVGNALFRVIYEQLNSRLLITPTLGNVRGGGGGEFTAIRPERIDYSFLWGRGGLGNLSMQMIDSSGKCFGVVILTRANTLISIYHLPQPPHKVQEATTNYAHNNAQLANNLIPTSLNARGAWYPAFGIERAFFVVLTPEAILNATKRFPVTLMAPLPAMISERSQIGLARRTKIVRVRSEILVKIITWLFSRSGKNARYFIDTTIVEDKRVVDDSQRYDFSGLPDSLPSTFVSTDADIKWLSQHTSQLISGNRVQLPANIISKLEVFLSRIKPDNSVAKLGDQFVDSEDFITRSNTTVIVGTQDYKRWLSSSGEGVAATVTKLGHYDIPLKRRFDLAMMPSQCAIDTGPLTGGPEFSRVSYMFPLKSTLEASVDAAREWFGIPQMPWLLVESSHTGSVEILQNETGGKVPYAVIFSHSDQKLYSLVIRVSG